MKLSISREALLKPLQLVAGVVERRQTLPILANVLIAVKDGQLSVTGTDLEVEVVGRAGADDVGEDDAVAVPARKFVDICRSLPEGAPIQLTTDPGAATARIVSGRSRFTLACLPASEFPVTEVSDAVCELRVAETVLKHLIDSTAFAIAHQDVRYYLNGMLWEVQPGLLRAAATDGHRLGMTTVPIAADVADRVQVIVPRKAVTELSRLLAGDGDLSVTLCGDKVRVRTEDFQLTSKLVEGAYPDYERVVPKGGKQILVGNREELRGAFARAAILSNEKYRGVRLLLSHDELRVVANNPVHEEAEEIVSLNYSGEAMEIGFNVGYILDVLSVLRGRDVRFTLTDANSSALVEDPTDERSAYVIMPMRL